MSEFFGCEVEIIESLQGAEVSTFMFVEDSSYEFVGGGAASTNGF